MENDAQSSNSVLMVRPAAFGFHPEAAASNVFAAPPADDEVQAKALREFDGVVERLTRAGVEVLVLDDTPDPPRPDAIFPNNWVSFHGEGTMVLYPMATAARRLERNVDGLTTLLSESGFDVRETIDLTFHERHGQFLEGTGSLVLDRPRRRSYASLGPRTDAAVIAEFDDRLDYSTLLFDAHDRLGRPIYHTNVALSLGTRYAILCSATVPAETLPVLVGELEANGRTVIEIDYDQLRQFACNVIELSGGDGQPLIALSSAARASFRADQLRLLEGFGELVDAAIPTIEAVGGGSLRCMVADIHLPKA